MDRMQWATLSEFQRVVLAEGESELVHEACVRLYDGDQRTEYDDGALTLTSHRLLWVEASAARRALQLPLALISHLDKEMPGLRLMSSPKIFVHLHGLPAQTAPGVAPSTATHIRLSFRRSGGKDHISGFLAALQQAVQQRQWEALPAAAAAPAMVLPAAAAPAVGILGLQRQKAEQLKTGDATIRAAFQGDLKDLMAKAKEMVALAERYTAKVSKSQETGDVSEADSLQFQNYMLSLGLVSPVTRSSHGSGAVYHRELARELAAFIKPALDAKGGSLLLQDVYSLYNRARGTELIAPDDLLHAAELFGELGLPMRLRRFASNVMAIQTAAQTDEALAADVLALLQRAQHVTAAQLAQLKDISVTLAQQHLLAAEALGVVCRDDTIEGLLFYPNRFREN